MDIGEMMKQAAALQSRMAAMQEKIASIEVEGAAGAGMVKVRLNGKGFCKSTSIDPVLLKPDDAEVLEDLIAAAINDAKAKLDAAAAEEMKTATAGLPLPPGMKLPF
jgi:nucleoid-associated protein EbfC